METREIIVGSEDSGKRIDKFITDSLCEMLSRMQVKNLINNGDVIVNGKKVKPNYSIRENDKIKIDPVLPEVDNDIEPEDIPLDVLYEDEFLIVVNKPAGMVVHPGAGNRRGTMVGALKNHCGSLAETGDSTRPGIVHRLDKDTSGVIIVAKDEKTMRSLSKQFQNRTIDKSYLAVVKGLVDYDNGQIDMPLARSGVDRKKMIVEHTVGKKAKTTYHVIKRYKKFTLLRAKPETGRTHQIRVHMKHLGHPIVGDRVYGRSTEVPRHFLHAEKIRFTHPGTGENVEFSAPLPDDMKNFLEEIE